MKFPLLICLIVIASITLAQTAPTTTDSTLTSPNRVTINCDELSKPIGFPDNLWQPLKPLLCQGGGMVNLANFPDICSQLWGDAKHHPICQIWSRQQTKQSINQKE